MITGLKNQKKMKPIDVSSDNDQLSNEITKLNNLLQSGVLTQEEFEKAKKKILDN